MKEGYFTGICFIFIGIVYSLDVMNNVFRGNVMESFMYAFPQLAFLIWIGFTIIVGIMEGRNKI